MNYKTRHLEAIVSVPMGDEYYVPGAKFFATHVDAEYLLQHKKVIEVKTASTPAPAEQPQADPTLPADDVIKTESTADAITGDGTGTALPPIEQSAPSATPAPAPAAEVASTPAPAPAPAPAARRPRQSKKTGAA